MHGMALTCSHWAQAIAVSKGNFRRFAGSERLAVTPAKVLFWAKGQVAATRSRLLPLPR